MNYSRRQLEALGEPFGDSCTRLEPGRHLICGGGGKGGGSSTNTVQKADPWKAVQPFLQELYPVAKDWFNSPTPQFYPSGTVAGQAPETLQGQMGVRDRALGGSPLQAGSQALGFRTLRGDFLNDPSQQLWSNPLMQGAAGYGLNSLGGAYLGLPEANLWSNPWMQNAAGLGMATMQGGFLGSNPFLDSMYRSASDPMVDQFSRAIAPAITSQFAAGGRYGSGLHQQAVTDAAGQLADALGSMGANLYGGAYESERGRQQQAMGLGVETAGMFQQALDQERARQQQSMGQNILASSMFQQGDEAARARQQAMIGMAPQLAQLDYNDLNTLMQLGGMREQRAQDLLNAEIARWDFGQNQPLSKINAYNQILMGGGGLGGTSSMTQGGGRGSPLGGAIGGGLLGYQAAPYIASMFGAGTGAAAGAGGGAAAGATAGSNLGIYGMLAGAILGGLLGG